MKTRLRMKTRFNKEIMESTELYIRPQTIELYEELYPFINKLSRKHRINISKKIALQLISYSFLYYSSYKESLIKEDLEIAMLIAKSSGIKEINSFTILKIFEKDIQKFKDRLKNDTYQLKRTAYHEVGHFILEHELKANSDKTFVSIIPFPRHSGVTTYTGKRKSCKTTLNEQIEKAAVSLAGDVSVEIFLGRKDLGIISDYKKATDAIHLGILATRNRKEGRYLKRLGCYGYIDPKNYSFQVDYSLLTERQREELSKQTSRYLAKAERLAKKTLKRNKDKVEILVEALMQRGALTEKQAELLYNGDIKLSDLPRAKIDYIN